MMKLVYTLFASVLIICGCASPRVSNQFESFYPDLTRSLDDFCRNPTPGIFSLPSETLWDFVIADEDEVRLGWARNAGEEEFLGPRFKSTLPSIDEMNALSLGQAESEIVERIGEPSRTWYDLYPVLDSVVPITRIFGRDTKHSDYRLFTTTSASDIVEMRISLSYAKDSNGSWLLTGVNWRIEGNRQWKSEKDKLVNSE